jgi:CBS domain containing-hemolysin-like protein
VTAAYLWPALAALAAATYFSALQLALVGESPAAIEAELARRRRSSGARWLSQRCRAAMFAVALLRMVARVGFFVLVLAEIVDLGAQATLRWLDLLVATVVTIPLLWVFTTVLSSALARYCGFGLVASGLPLMRVATFTLSPLIAAVAFIDEAVRRLSGAHLRTENQHETELLRSIEETQREGGLDEEAAELLENVVQFTETDVGEIMTPRTDIHAIELTDDLTLIRDFIAEVGHSRIPVYQGDMDHIIGVLYVRDLIPYLGTDARGFALRQLLRQPIIVPQTKLVGDLLADFRRAEVHMAIVVDEYGGTAGLVTIEDVLEEIVGEIRDEHEPDRDDTPALVNIDARHVEVDGRYNLDDLSARLGLRLPEDRDFDTVAGFVLAHLGRVPKVGESFEAHDARFTTLAASPRAVQRVGIELLTTPSANGERRE